MSKNIIKLTLFALFFANITVFAQEKDNSEDFLCCSINDLYDLSIKEVSLIEDERPISENDEDLIEIESQRSYRNNDKEIIILQGNTKIKRANETVTSQLANVLQKQEKIRLSGDVNYDNTEIEIKAPYAEHNMSEATTDFIAPIYRHKLLEINGKANYAIKDKEKILLLKNSSYTSCDLLNPDWSLFSTDSKLNFEDGVGTAKNVFLKVKDVPIFYSPYMRFSLDDQRKTGFLTPSISGDWGSGPDLAAPFYWNIATNADLLLTPEYIQDRGAAATGHYRYLEKKYTGELYLSYLHDDDEYKDDRYSYFIEHKGSISEDIQVDLKYNKVSDKDYFSDLSSGISSSSTVYLDRHAKISMKKNGWNLNLNYIGYQVTDKNIANSDQPYEKLPEITLNKSWNDKRNINYSLNSSFVAFNHLSKVDGNRGDIQFKIKRKFSSKGMFVEPALKFQHTSYDLEKQNSSFTSSPSKTIPSFSLDGGMKFTSKIENSKLVNQISPRLFYLYSKDENQDDIPLFDSGIPEFSFSQLFRDNNFYGVDRTSDSNHLSIGITSSFYDLERKANIFSASIGQIVYFDNRDVTLNANEKYTRTNSQVAAELIANPIDNVFLASSLLFDPHSESQKTNKFLNSVMYKKGKDIFNLSYRYRKNEIEQGDVSFLYSMNENLRLLGRWNYEFKNNSLGQDSGDIEVLAGLEYESCCWKFRLVSKRYKINETDYDRNIQFQFMLKGFTDVGTPLGTVLEDSIYGYSEEDF